MNKMTFLAALLICTTLGAVFPERIFDPKYEGNEEIANFRIDLSGEDPVFEWDFLAGKREYVGFDILLDPPIFIDAQGKLHHESTTDTVFTARRLEPYTQYNVTIKAYRHSEPIDAVSETLTFKTKPSIPEIVSFLLITSTQSENDTDLSDLMLFCFAKGTPLPFVKIYHNGEPMDAHKEYEAYGFFNSIVYFNRTLTSYGIYTCNATNIAAATTKDIEHKYTDKDSDILIKTVVDLVDQTEERREEYDVRITNMEETLNEMKNQMKEIKELLHNETEDD